MFAPQTQLSQHQIVPPMTNETVSAPIFRRRSSIPSQSVNQTPITKQPGPSKALNPSGSQYSRRPSSEYSILEHRIKINQRRTSLKSNSVGPMAPFKYGDAILCGSYVGIVRYHGPLQPKHKYRGSNDIYIGLECCSEEETKGLEGHDGLYRDFRYFDTEDRRKTGIMISEREFTQKLEPLELLQTIERQKKKMDILVEQNKLLSINLEALLLRQVQEHGNKQSEEKEDMDRSSKHKSSEIAIPTVESLLRSEIHLEDPPPNVTMRMRRQVTEELQHAMKNAAQFVAAPATPTPQHISAQSGLSGGHTSVVSGALSFNSEPIGHVMAPLDPPALMTRKAHSKVKLGVVDGVPSSHIISSKQQPLQQNVDVPVSIGLHRSPALSPDAGKPYGFNQGVYARHPPTQYVTTHLQHPHYVQQYVPPNAQPTTSKMSVYAQPATPNAATKFFKVRVQPRLQKAHTGAATAGSGGSGPGTTIGTTTVGTSATPRRTPLVTPGTDRTVVYRSHTPITPMRRIMDYGSDHFMDDSGSNGYRGSDWSGSTPEVTTNSKIRNHSYTSKTSTRSSSKRSGKSKRRSRRRRAIINPESPRNGYSNRSPSDSPQYPRRRKKRGSRHHRRREWSPYGSSGSFSGDSADAGFPDTRRGRDHKHHYDSKSGSGDTADENGQISMTMLHDDEHQSNDSNEVDDDGYISSNTVASKRKTAKRMESIPNSHITQMSHDTVERLRTLIRTDTERTAMNKSPDLIERMQSTEHKEQPPYHTTFISIDTDVDTLSRAFSINNPDAIMESEDEQYSQKGKDGKMLSAANIPGLNPQISEVSTVAGCGFGDFNDEVHDVHRQRIPIDEMKDESASMEWSEGSSSVDESSVVYALEMSSETRLLN